MKVSQAKAEMDPVVDLFRLPQPRPKSCRIAPTRSHMTSKGRGKEGTMPMGVRKPVGSAGAWHDARMDCRLQPAAPIGPSPLTPCPFLGPSSLRRWRCPSASHRWPSSSGLAYGCLPGGPEGGVACTDRARWPPPPWGPNPHAVYALFSHFCCVGGFGDLGDPLAPTLRGAGRDAMILYHRGNNLRVFFLGGLKLGGGGVGTGP